MDGTGGPPPSACPFSFAGHTLPSPVDAGRQASSKFALCHQGEGIVSSLSPQLPAWAAQGGQCCCALGCILTSPIPATLHCHCGLQQGTGTPPPVTECLPCPQSSPCHHAVIPMASKGQWRCPYSLGGHGGLPALGLGLRGQQSLLESLQGSARVGSAPGHCPRAGVAAALTLFTWLSLAPRFQPCLPLHVLGHQHGHSASAMLSPEHGAPGAGDVLELPVYCYQTKQR